MFKLGKVFKPRSFELALAVMHTTGQAFPMAFQAGGPHAQDRGLEAVATAWALTQAKRPNYTITTPQIDAHAVGEFFFLYELQTVMAGALYGVNPFGQPGVEAGKNATYALMGRSGYESLRDELLAGSTGASPFVIEP